MKLIKSCNKLIIQGMKRTLFLEEVQIHVTFRRVNAEYEETLFQFTK